MSLAVMVDVDGVVVRHPRGERWDRDLAADLGIDPAALHARFFAPFFADIALGRDDLHVRLASVLATLAPEVDSATLVDYWFRHDAHLDEELLRDVGAARRSGLGVHLATTQEPYRARYLWDVLGLRAHFDDIHSSGAIGSAKPAEGFYRAVECRTGRRPAELLLIDDRAENVQGAIDAGWRAHLWTPASRLSDVEGIVEAADS